MRKKYKCDYVNTVESVVYNILFAVNVDAKLYEIFNLILLILFLSLSLSDMHVVSMFNVSMSYYVPHL